MIKNSIIVLCFSLVTASAHAQYQSKNLVYKSTVGDLEKDRSWFYTVSPDNRFIVLNCGNYRLSKKTTANICYSDISTLRFYDTYEKKLKSIDLSSVFSFSEKNIFAFSFVNGSNLVVAELPADEDFGSSKDLVPTEYKQKIVSINLNAAAIEAQYTSGSGKICTQLGSFASQLVCAQNTFHKSTADSYTRDLDLVFYNSSLSKVIKSVAISKNKSFTMIPQINETEFVTNKSVRPARLLVATEDLGGHMYTTGDSFSIDTKTGDIQLIPELNTVENTRSEVQFVGNYTLSNSAVSLYLIAYYPKYNGPNNPPVKTATQFLILNGKNAVLLNAPQSWGDFKLDSILGVITDKSGLPVVFKSSIEKHDDESSRLSLEKYSLFTADTSTIFRADYDSDHFNSYVAWDDNSESFFLLNGIHSESESGYTISEIQQVDLDGVIVQKNPMSIRQGHLYLNPRSSNPLLVEYDEQGNSLFSTVYTYSAAKRKPVLVDREHFNIPFGYYEAPIFVGEKSLVIVSALFEKTEKQDYSIYYYEY